MRGLDPRIHLLRLMFFLLDGLPGLSAATPCVAALPGNDDDEVAHKLRFM
jgi:hypothetical protein